MLKWLKNKLRKWLADDDLKVCVLECVIDGKIQRAAVIGASGLKVVVSTGEGTYLVGRESALNGKEFWTAWQQQSGDVRWSDGDKFDPKEMR